MAQSVLSVRNQPKIVDNGYAYTFDKRSKDETLRFYRCDKRYDDCPARIHVSVETGEIVSRLHDHNHGNDAARIEAAKTYYIGRRRNDNIRRQPLFEKALWSVHARTVNHLDRTNNHAEAAHRKLQAMLQMDHPSLWKFIDALMHVRKETDFRYEQYVRGDDNVPKRKKYREADERILNIVGEYRNREIIEYLRGIAHNFQME